jgi:hypothetical protein
VHELPPRGISGNARGLPNLLNSFNLLKLLHPDFPDFGCLSTFWQILDGFSHTDSHTIWGHGSMEK